MHASRESALRAKTASNGEIHSPAAAAQPKAPPNNTASGANPKANPNPKVKAQASAVALIIHSEAESDKESFSTDVSTVSDHGNIHSQSMLLSIMQITAAFGAAAYASGLQNRKVTSRKTLRLRC